MELMEKELKKVLNAVNKCFFDIIGGKELVLVAMGMLPHRYKVAMHKVWFALNEISRTF